VVRGTIATDESYARVTLPGQVVSVNQALGQLLSHINDLYDQSQVAAPLEKVIDLSAYKDANTFGYAVRRVEGFTRYVLTAAARSESGTAATSLFPLLPVTLAGTPPKPPAAPAAETPQPLPGEIVARGTFELHQYDRASVVAGYVLSSIPDRSYGSQQRAAVGDSPAGLYPIVTSESRWQPQVLLGLNYYLRPRDVHPSARHTLSSLSNFGVVAGVSLTDLNNYFAGMLWEPKLGFNIGAGAHFGQQTAVQGPYADGTTPLPDATVPTFERRAVGFYLYAGLDIDIFRKVFGKASGVGTAASVHPR